MITKIFILIIAILCLFNLQFYVNGMPVDVQLMGRNHHEQAPQHNRDSEFRRGIITNSRLSSIPIDDRLALLEKTVLLVPDNQAWFGLVTQLFKALEEAGMDRQSIQYLGNIAQRAYEPFFVQEILDLNSLAKEAGVSIKTFLADPRNDRAARMRLNPHSMMGSLIQKLKYVAPGWEEELDEIYAVGRISVLLLGYSMLTQPICKNRANGTFLEIPIRSLLLFQYTRMRIGENC